MSKAKQESFRPPPNLPPGKGWKGKIICAIRQTADLMVASVVLYLKPWLVERKGIILEIGCGAQPYRHFLPPSCSYQGLDWESSEEHFGYSAPDTTYYTGGQFPFMDASFDNLYHTEVLEHIYDYKVFLRECRRVLKPGGNMFFA
ncbi:MAG: class I SAM-dependent methyltransferase, partial [Desulfobacteraceae bacterium]|nr:class I SAM-dependent methyltransferase [Desulfobacteraceae bacterium]